MLTGLVQGFLVQRDKKDDCCTLYYKFYSALHSLPHFKAPEMDVVFSVEGVTRPLYFSTFHSFYLPSICRERCLFRPYYLSCFLSRRVA
jgi:hypothetical protein